MPAWGGGVVGTRKRSTLLSSFEKHLEALDYLFGQAGSLFNQITTKSRQWIWLKLNWKLPWMKWCSVLGLVMSMGYPESAHMSDWQGWGGREWCNFHSIGIWRGFWRGKRTSKKNPKLVQGMFQSTIPNVVQMASDEDPRKDAELVTSVESIICRKENRSALYIFKPN